MDSQMNNDQYTNIMVALGKLEQQGKNTNAHLETLNGKVATNVSAIKNLEKEDVGIKNELMLLTRESTKRQENNQWWQRHISGIVVSVVLGGTLLVLQITGILNLNV